MASASKLKLFVDGLQAHGTYTFSREEAGRSLGFTEGSLRNALVDLVAQGRIVRLRRGLYVIVPLEYRSAGILPPYWFVDGLMAHLGLPYYVGLLSAAEVHGAAHQRPQEFQLVVPTCERQLATKALRIRFVRKPEAEATPVVKTPTTTGTMRVSTPEATAVDLVRYPVFAGGLDNVATVLAELATAMDGEKLAQLAAAEPPRRLPVLQRLGYLLDEVGASSTAAPLAQWMAGRTPALRALDPRVPLTGAARVDKWAVVANVKVEPDL